MKIEKNKNAIKSRLTSIVNNALSIIDFARICLREENIDAADLDFAIKYVDEMKSDFDSISEYINEDKWHTH